VTDPIRVLVLRAIGEIATELALLTFQERVEVPKGATSVGEAVKEEMEGRDPFCVVPEAMEEEAERLPTLSWAVT
jgi:hypothetical protein